MATDTMTIPPQRAASSGGARFLWLLSVLLFLGSLTQCSNSGTATAAPGEEGVRRFLNRYFETWSNRDMTGYGDCFHAAARVYLVTDRGEVQSQGLTDFLHGQRMAHERATSPMKEVPLEMKIHMDQVGAQAYVTWKLTKGSGEETGVDLFTLKREGSDWKILSLVFYGD